MAIQGQNKLGQMIFQCLLYKITFPTFRQSNDNLEHKILALYRLCSETAAFKHLQHGISCVQGCEEWNSVLDS